MNVALASIFRNSATYLERYFLQVNALAAALQKDGHTLRVIGAEADSTDDTAERLQAARNGGLNITVVNRDNGSPWFGSVDLADRWRAISYVCNGALELVTNELDAVIYVESDLIWNVETMRGLLDNLQQVDACAAMCFHQSIPTMFYDTWGHRKDGQRFTAHAPYHSRLSGLTEIDSAGSCIVMRGLVARNARFYPPELGIVGFCNDMRGRGFTLYVDPTRAVYHP